MRPRTKAKVEDDALIERRRQQLTLAAIACFGERGYHSTTIRDVAERAEVSVGLIYQYVDDKEDLLFLALQEVLELYRRQIPVALSGLSDPLERFRAAVSLLLPCQRQRDRRDGAGVPRDKIPAAGTARHHKIPGA